MRLTENELRTVIRNILLEKRFDQLSGYDKNKELNIKSDLLDDENDELRDSAFDIIDKSYKYIGGNSSFKEPDDLKDPKANNYSDFLAWDIDDDPEIDILRGMKPKSGGMKLVLGATDGETASKEFSKLDTIKRLNSKGYWAEMSGKVAVMTMKGKVKAITDKSKALKLVNKPDVVWFGEHPYFKNPKKYSELKVEAEKSKQYAKKYNMNFDGWYERSIGGENHVKMAFGNI